MDTATHDHAAVGHPSGAAPGDLALADIIDGMIAADAWFGVTFLVNGVLVSGTTISAGEYADRFDAQLTEAWRSAGLEAAPWHDGLTRLRQSAGDRGGEAAGAPRFVHLRDVVIVGGGGQRVNVPLWRGRLDHVSGWFLGTPAYA